MIRFVFLTMIIGIFTTGSAQADQCQPLPEGMKCHAENGDGPAIYMVGREAYDEARISGDFGEARQWALRAMDAKFFPAAKMLYKMVHLQIGDGAHHDLVQSHRWIVEAVDGGADYLKPFIRRLEAKMTPEQKAQALSTE